MQATERYNSFDIDRKYRFQLRLVEAFSDNRISQSLRNTLATYWRTVHPDLGQVVLTLRPTITRATPVNEPPVNEPPATTAPIQTPTVEQKSDQSTAITILVVFLVLVSVALVVSIAMNFIHRNIITRSQHSNRERLLYDTTKNDL